MPILLICEAVESWRHRGINYFSSKRTRGVCEPWGRAGTTLLFLSLLIISAFLRVQLSSDFVNKNHHVARMRPRILVLLCLWWWNLIKLNKVRSMNQKQLSFNQIFTNFLSFKKARKFFWGRDTGTVFQLWLRKSFSASLKLTVGSYQIGEDDLDNREGSGLLSISFLESDCLLFNCFVST